MNGVAEKPAEIAMDFAIAGRETLAVAICLDTFPYPEGSPFRGGELPC